MHNFFYFGPSSKKSGRRNLIEALSSKFDQNYPVQEALNLFHCIALIIQITEYEHIKQDFEEPYLKYHQQHYQNKYQHPQDINLLKIYQDHQFYIYCVIKTQIIN